MHPKIGVIPLLVGVITFAGCGHALSEPSGDACLSECTPRKLLGVDAYPVVRSDERVFLAHAECLGAAYIDGDCRVVFDFSSAGIWVCRSDGSDLVPALQKPVGHYDISPDESRLVYQLWAGVWMVLLRDGVADTSSARLLDPEGWRARWSPDGQRVAYVVFGDEGGTYCVRVDAEDSPKRLTESLVIWDWSPSGDEILGRLSGSTYLGVFSIPDSILRVLPVEGDVARWSPDGSRVAFITYGVGTHKLGVLDLATESVRWYEAIQVSVGGLAWSLDGTSLVVQRWDRAAGVSSTNGTLWRVDVESGEAVPLTRARCLEPFDD